MNVATDRAGSQPLSRRALICASPVLFAPSAMGNSATEIQRLYLEHTALRVSLDLLARVEAARRGPGLRLDAAVLV